MRKRSLYLETDYISDSDEPFQTEVDFMSDDEKNDYIDYLMKRL